MSQAFTNTPVTTTQAATPPTQEAPKTETPPVVATPEAPKKEDLYSQRAQILLNKEKKAYRAKEEAKALRAAIDNDRAELSKREARMQEFEKIKADNPMKALEFLGLSYNDLTQYFLNNGNPTPEIQVQGVRKEIEDLRKAQEERDRLQVEQAKAQAERDSAEVIQAFQGEINSFVTERSDEYEFINVYGLQNRVYNKIQEFFNETQKVLSIKEGADLVEEEVLGELKKAQATKKYKQLTSPPPPSDKKVDNSFQSKAHTQPRTLSNNMTSNVASTLPAKTEQERMARAMAALDRR